MLVGTTADFVGALRKPVARITDLLQSFDDTSINTVPDLPGANSAHQIAVHCAGVLEFWGTGVLEGDAGRRDRDMELRSVGSVQGALRRLSQAHERFEARLQERTGDVIGAPERGREQDAPPEELTFGGVLLHMHRELCQHCGHLEITRDLLASRPTQAPAGQ